MSWINKINAIFLTIILIVPIVCVTAATVNDVSDISSLIINITEEEQEDKKSRENVLYLEDSLHISFLSPGGSVTSEVSASRGTYFRDRGLALLEGNVEMTNVRGERLQTEKLYWDERNEEIYNHTFVRIETEREYLECDSGMTANTDFTRWRLKGSVNGIAAYPKNENQ